MTPMHTTTAIEPTRNRLRSTEAPVMRIDTMLMTGSPSSVAVEISETAVTPVAAQVVPMPAWRSMSNCMAPPAAAPPGTMRLKAFAGQLRRRHGEPRLDVERQAQQRPHAGEAAPARRARSGCPRAG